MAQPTSLDCNPSPFGCFLFVKVGVPSRPFGRKNGSGAGAAAFWIASALWSFSRVGGHSKALEGQRTPGRCRLARGRGFVIHHSAMWPRARRVARMAWMAWIWSVRFWDLWPKQALRVSAFAPWAGRRRRRVVLEWAFLRSEPRLQTVL